MKSKRMLVLFALVLTTVFALSACGNNAGPTAVVQPVPAAADFSNGSIVAEGRIVPRDSANLFFMSGGMIDEVLVKEGDSVLKGDVLVRLGKHDSFEANVAAAQAERVDARCTTGTMRGPSRRFPARNICAYFGAS